MVLPPKSAEPSFKTFMKEENHILESLKRRSITLAEGLNRIEGIECNAADGAMYLFPRLLNLPVKAQEAAKSSGMALDTFYAMSMLEETGICVVPASGFGQKEGRNGFRTTFLLPDRQIMKVVKEFARHHIFFCDKYA